MWCVPTAVAALIGWSREKVWLDILAQRHERGRRLTNVPGRLDEPHGGLHAAEAIRTLERAGYRVIRAWEGTRRMSLAAFEDFVDADEVVRGQSRWLVLQQMHLAHLNRRHRRLDYRGSMIPGLPIALAWRVEPIKRGGDDVSRLQRPRGAGEGHVQSAGAAVDAGA